MMDAVLPKVMIEEEETSFFGALGDVFSEYTGASVLFGLFALLCALGVGYVVRNTREDQPLTLKTYPVDAELDD